MARAEIQGLEAAGGSGAEWETVARRYPASAPAARAWAGAATGYHAEQRWPAAERAARSGLRSAERALRRSQPPEPAQVNELAGVLLSALVNQGRADEAGEALAEAASRFGAVQPAIGGVGVAVSTEGSQRRLPIIGPRIARSDTLTLLPGTPVAGSDAGEAGLDPSLVVMHAAQIGELAVYRANEIASEGGVDRALWRQDGVGSVPPVLAHADSRALVLVWGDELQTGRPARAEARDPATGRVLWERELRMAIDRIDPGPDPAARLNGQIVSPVEGSVANAHLLAAGDGRTLVVADRLGRTVGVDLADGRVLWSRLLGLTRLYGMDLRGGVLGVCGAVAQPNAEDDAFAEAGLRGVGEALDARTGETIQLIDDLGAEARWVRVAPDGQVIVASGSRIVAMDSLAGRIDWSNADEELGLSQDAWVLGDSLGVLGADRALWLLSRREGVRARAPLDTNGRGWDRGRVRVERREFGFVVAGASGVTTHAPDGTLLAADALDARGFAESAPARSRVALIDEARAEPGGRASVDAVLVDARTGRTEDRVTVALPEGVRRVPTRVVAADGVVVVGFNEVSVVLSVPGGDG
jgi:outer membrane protein assembly factor BamB